MNLICIFNKKQRRTPSGSYCLEEEGHIDNYCVTEDYSDEPYMGNTFL